MDKAQNIAKYYNSHVLDEDQRLTSCSMEYLVTRYLIDLYASDAENVCDLGGGTGIYAVPLAQGGKHVTLVDLSSEEIKLAIEKAVQKGVHIDSLCCNILTNDFQIKNKFDLVLCLGPLYHCGDVVEVDKILDRIYSMLGEQSYVILSFLSKYSKFNDVARIYGLSKYRRNKVGEFISERAELLLDIRAVNDFYEEILQQDKTFYFFDKSGIPISYIEPSLIGAYLKDKGFDVLEVVSSDICDHIEPSTPKNEINRFIEVSRKLGAGGKINDGNHVLVVLKKV